MYQFHRRLQTNRLRVNSNAEEGTMACLFCEEKLSDRTELHNHIATNHILYFPLQCGKCGTNLAAIDKRNCSCRSKKTKETRQKPIDDFLDKLLTLIDELQDLRSKTKPTLEIKKEIIEEPVEKKLRKRPGPASSKQRKDKPQIQESSKTEKCNLCEDEEVRVENQEKHVLEHLKRDNGLSLRRSRLEHSKEYRDCFQSCFQRRKSRRKLSNVTKKKEGEETNCVRTLRGRVRNSIKEEVIDEVPSKRPVKTLVKPRRPRATKEEVIRLDENADFRAREQGFRAEISLRRLSPRDFPFIQWDRGDLKDEESEASEKTETPTRGREFRKNECRMCCKVIQVRYQLKHTLQQHYTKGCLECPFCDGASDLNPSELRKHVEEAHSAEDIAQKTLSRPLPEIQNLHERCFPQEQKVKVPEEAICSGACQVCHVVPQSQDEHVYEHLASDDAKHRYHCSVPDCTGRSGSLEIILRHCKGQHEAGADFKDRKWELRKDFVTKTYLCFGTSGEDSRSGDEELVRSWNCEFCDETQITAPVDHVFLHLATSEGLQRYRCIFEECQAEAATEAALREHASALHSISLVCKASLAIMDQVWNEEVSKRVLIWWRSCFKNSKKRPPELIRRMSHAGGKDPGTASRPQVLHCRSCASDIIASEEAHLADHLESLCVFQFVCTVCRESFKSLELSKTHQHDGIASEVFIANRENEPGFKEALNKARQACFEKEEIAQPERQEILEELKSSPSERSGGEQVELATTSPQPCSSSQQPIPYHYQPLYLEDQALEIPMEADDDFREILTFQSSPATDNLHLDFGGFPL